MSADRFVDLACLTYMDDESRERRATAEALLTPALVESDVHAAAAAGDLDALRKHVDVDRIGTSRNWSPLMALCYSRIAQRDPLGCLDYLLAQGADPNSFVMLGDGNKFTALTGVIGEGEAGPFEQPPHPYAREMAIRLLDAGADPNDSQAIYNTHFLPDNSWLELLLARGLKAELDFLLGQAAVQGFTDRVKLLLAHGVSPNGRNRYNKRTHLENALPEGHADIADLLVAAGAPETLIVASRHGRVDAVVRALDLGASIDGRDADGLTALHHAARNGHLDVVKLLVERGASRDVRDPVYDGTPLGHAKHFTARWPRPDGPAIIALLS